MQADNNMTEPILLQIEGQAAIITLNRPDRLNSFNQPMHQALQAALDEVEEASPVIRALLITGAGRGFCAGQDLSDRNVAADAVNKAFAEPAHASGLCG